MVVDKTVLAHIYTMFKAEQVGHLSLRTLAETHSHLRCVWDLEMTSATNDITDQRIHSYSSRIPALRSKRDMKLSSDYRPTKRVS